MAILDFPKNGSDSWRRYPLKGICCCIEREVGVSSTWGQLDSLSGGTGDRKENMYGALLQL